MKMAERLKLLMSQRGVTQKELSLGCKISQSLVSDYLNEKVDASAKNVQKFALYFDVSLDWLMGGDETGDRTLREPEAGYGLGGLVDQIAKLSKADREIVEALVESLLKRGSKNNPKK